MDERRRCTTVRQMELMVQFLEQHRDLALGRVRSKEARQVAARLWNECATNLNVEGPARTGKEWSKVRIIEADKSGCYTPRVPNLINVILLFFR